MNASFDIACFLKSLGMQLLQLFLGSMALLLAYILFFKKSLIFKMNAFMRDYVFADHVVLFSGGRIAILLLILGTVALFSGVDRVTRGQFLRPRIASKIFDQALAADRSGRHDEAVSRCQELLRSDPNNLAALELMATAYTALGQKDQAREALLKILSINPHYPLKNSRIDKATLRHRETKKP
jgi:tetratricopeptide (TPR) repeat protein